MTKEQLAFEITKLYIKTNPINPPPGVRMNAIVYTTEFVLRYNQVLETIIAKNHLIPKAKD